MEIFRDSIFCFKRFFSMPLYSDTIEIYSFTAIPTEKPARAAAGFSPERLISIFVTHFDAAWASCSVNYESHFDRNSIRNNLTCFKCY